MASIKKYMEMIENSKENIENLKVFEILYIMCGIFAIFSSTGK